MSAARERCPLMLRTGWVVARRTIFVSPTEGSIPRVALGPGSESALGLTVSDGPSSPSTWRYGKVLPIALGLFLLGVGLVASGWLLDEEAYLSDLALSLGTTMVLVVPLFAINQLIESRLSNLAEKVDDIQRELVRFEGSAPPGFRDSVKRILSRSTMRLEELGLATGSTGPRVVVSAIDAPSYDPTTNVIAVPAELAEDENAVLAQYVHHILHALPGRSQGELSGPARAIEQGVAWFLTCSATENPQYGALNLADRHVFPVRKPGEMGKHPRADDAWASAFWGLRTFAPPRTVDSVVVAAYSTVLSRRHRSVWVAFATALLQDVRLGAHRTEVTALLEDRGFPLAADAKARNGPTS